MENQQGRRIEEKNILWQRQLERRGIVFKFEAPVSNPDSLPSRLCPYQLFGEGTYFGDTEAVLRVSGRTSNVSIMAPASIRVRWIMLRGTCRLLQ